MEEDITLFDASPMILPEEIEQTQPIEGDLLAVTKELSKADGVIMGNVADLTKSVEKLQDAVDQLTGEINILRKSIENLQKENEKLGKRLKKIEKKVK